MDRARKQGKRIGRPRVTDRRGFSRRFGAILERVSAGDLSRRQAARELPPEGNRPEGLLSSFWSYFGAR